MKVISLAAGLCFSLITLPLSAGEFGRMSVDFETPIWQELLTPCWGSLQPYKIEADDQEHGKVLTCRTRGMLMTGYFENIGQKITVDVDLKTDGITVHGTWECAAIQVYGYNANKKMVTHTDVTLQKGTTPWTHYRRTIQLSQNCKYFTVAIGNAGASGTAYIDNLRLSQELPCYQNLIGDSGFEGRLGADHWFLEKTGKDWDNLALSAGDRFATEDKSVAAEGKKCLYFDGPGTVASHKFPYQGEQLWIGGWMRTEKVKIGNRSWAMAGIQVVGLDGEGKQVTHTDLRLLSGTNSWQYFTRKLRFSSTVKYVQVWPRIFDTASGRAWMDGVTLLRLPPDEQVKSFDAKKAVVTLDPARPEPKTINPIWRGTDGLYTGWWTETPYWKERLDMVKAAGFDYVRCREIMYALHFYDRDDEQGNPVYTWDKFDAFFDTLVKDYGFKMVPTISTTPLALVRPGDKPTWCNHNPPKDYKKWSVCVEAMLNHCIERYGAETVSRWVWEFWNEPRTTGEGETLFAKTGSGQVDPVCLMYEGVVDAFTRVEKKHGISLTLSMTSGDPVTDELILAYLTDKAPEKIRAIDGLSIHIYAGSCSPMTAVSDACEELKKRSRRYKMRDDARFWCTEWNASSMLDALMDQPFAAACAVKTAKIYLEKGLDFTTFFSAYDCPFFDKESLFRGDTGLMTKTGIPKAVYNAFVFMNELRDGKRIPLESSNDPIDGLAVVMPDGTIRMVLCSFDEDLNRAPYITQVRLQIKVNAPLQVSRYWLVDENHGNIYKKWQALGKPSATDTQARQILLEASKYASPKPPAVRCDDSSVNEIEMSILSHAVIFLELKPQP